MNAEWKLTVRYLCRHWKQFLTSALCIAVFSSGILTALLFQGCFENATREQKYELYGRLGGFSYEVDDQRVSPETLKP